ncbi:hypothetical protein BD779DRAFT_1683173 [Infundibulicybe gibba]|nr:hypothetical protein BD779DRAFT_1683173 [Infundibulicybe gibba]
MSDAVSRAKSDLKHLFTQYPKPDANPSELHEWASVFLTELAAYDSALNGALRDDEVIGWMMEIRPRMVDAFGPNWQAAVQAAPTAGTTDTPAVPEPAAETSGSTQRVTRATSAKSKGKERATTAPVRARPANPIRRSNRARAMVPNPGPKCDTCAKPEDCEWDPQHGRREAWVTGQAGTQADQDTTPAQPTGITTAAESVAAPVLPSNAAPAESDNEGLEEVGANQDEHRAGAGRGSQRKSEDEETEMEMDDSVSVKLKPPIATDRARYAKQACRDQALGDKRVIKTPTPTPSQSDDENSDGGKEKEKAGREGRRHHSTFLLSTTYPPLRSFLIVINARRHYSPTVVTSRLLHSSFYSRHVITLHSPPVSPRHPPLLPSSRLPCSLFFTSVIRHSRFTWQMSTPSYPHPTLTASSPSASPPVTPTPLNFLSSSDAHYMPTNSPAFCTARMPLAPPD